MNNGIIETIKTNRKAILKKALVVAGAVVGLVIVAKAVKSRNDGEEVIPCEDAEVVEVGSSDESKENE